MFLLFCTKEPGFGCFPVAGDVKERMQMLAGVAEKRFSPP